MLACLPAPAYSATSLLCLQMNTGPPRWETTQKMRSPTYPSPADLDAYAKKVANNPLTIQIFPNSVKVPQRKHVRRTVNGLDTSQRHSPYASQLSASAGLLAVLRAPVKAPAATRNRGPQKAAMNLHSGPYGPQGTLNNTHMQGPSQQAPLTHSLSLQHNLPQSAPHAPPLQHKAMPHPGPLQRQQSMSQLQSAHRPTYPHGIQRQQSVPLAQQCAPSAQHAPLLHTLRHHDSAAPHHAPPNAPHNTSRNGSRTALGLQTHEVHHISQLNMAHPQTIPQTMSNAGQVSLPPGGTQPGTLQPRGLHSVTSRASQQGPPRVTQQGPAPLQHGPETGPPRGNLQGPPGGQYLGPPGPLQGGAQPRPLRAAQSTPTGGAHSTPSGSQPGPPGSQPGGLQTPLGGSHPCPLGSQPVGPQQGPSRAPIPDPPGGASFMGDTVPQSALGPFGPRKLPDADAPPNVTVSTSTIPLSMAGSLHQSRTADLSSIVLQINQLCQARAGMGGTSVCEGQIANPSPISRNLLINASSRVAHPPAAMATAGYHMTAVPDKLPGHTPGLQLTSKPNMSSLNGLQSFHSEVEKTQSLMQRSWAHHQLAHMQQPPDEAHPCKAPRLEPPSDCSFAPPQNLGYTHKVPSSAQGFLLKHQDKSRTSPPVCAGTSLPYMDSQYHLQQTWGPSQEGSGFQGPRVGLPERFTGQKYKMGKDDPGDHAKLLPNIDFVPGNFQIPRFGDQTVDLRGPRQEPGPGGPLPGHHPGYR